MEVGWTHELLTWLESNPGWGWVIVFLISFFESLVLIGIVLPGIMILFGVGAMIGLGVMELLPIWLAASSGAFLGDGISYWLGHRYREHLLDFWPFSRYPNVMHRGRRFFERHGEKSVVAGRFIGPLRPIIPAVVGMMGMKSTRFVTSDIVACIAWAPSFLLPGVLFGASLEVASEYTGRLAVVLIVLLLTLWVSWWILRSLYVVLASRSARWLRKAIHWTRKHPVLGRIAGPLLDPSQPEVLSVSMLGVLLILLFWGIIMLGFLGPFAPQPQGLDQAIADFALALRNEVTDPLMVAISQLGRWQVTVLSALAVLLWLLGAGQMSAAKHWVAAIGGGVLIQLLLVWGLRATPQVFEFSTEEVPGPSSAMSLATVVLTFFALLVAREIKRNHRQWPYLAAGLTLTMLCVARLYLGLEWFSGALLGFLVGMTWVSIVGIAYRQRRKKPFSGAVASVIFFSALIFLFSWQVSRNLRTDLAQLQVPIPERSVPGETWWRHGWAELPVERTRLVSATSRRFNIQAAVSIDRIGSVLAEHGWQPANASDWRWLVSALNPEPDETTLPILGRSFLGRAEELHMWRDAPGPNRLQTVRFWDSGWRLEPGGEKIYLGQVSEEELVQRLRFFSYWRSVPYTDGELRDMADSFRQLEVRDTGQDVLLVRERSAGEPEGRAPPPDQD